MINFSLSLFCSWLFFLTTLVSSTPLINIASRQNIENELNTLINRNNLTITETLILANYKKSIQFYDELTELEKQTKIMQKRIIQAPKDAQNALNKLNKIKQEQQLNKCNKIKYLHLTLPQLEIHLKNKLEILQNQQEHLADINSNLVALQTQPERAMNIMLENAKRLQDIRYQLNNDLLSNDEIRPSLQILLQIEQFYLQQQNKFQQYVLEANTQLQDVLQKQRDYITTYIELIQNDIQYVQATINNKRLNYSEETAKEAQRSTINSQEIEEYPIIKYEKAINKAFSERLINVTQDSNQLVQKAIRVKSWLKRAIQIESNLKEQITVLRGSLLLSRILFQKQINLPHDILTKNLQTLIADLRLEQFDINQERDKLYQPSNYINKLVSTINDSIVDRDKTFSISKELKLALELLIDIRRDLLDQLNVQLGNQISQAINLQLDQQQLLSVIGSLKQTLAQQIFWVNSNKPIDFAWLTSFPDAAKAEIASFNFKLPLFSIFKGLINSSIVTIPLLLFCLLFFWMNSQFKQRLKAINSEVKIFTKDNQLNTPVALILALLIAAPGAFILLIIGYWFLKTGNSHGDFIWDFTLQISLFWLLFRWCICILRPNGIAENHFLIDKKNVIWLRQRLMNLILQLIVLIYWSSYGVMYPLRLADDVIGQLIVLISLFFVFLFILPFCRCFWQQRGSHLIRIIIITILVFSPLILIGLMMIGYYYTTLRLFSRWIDSLYLLLLWYIIYHSCLRGLSIAARKLTYKRALERRHNMTREEQENEPIIEPPMSIELISQQSLRLTSMILFLIFIVAFYWIWSDFITIFSFLDGIQLWHTSVQNETGHALQAVTLADLILSIIIFIIALIMTQNLPGLLEVLVLSKLSLRQGSSYAITTMLTYVIIAIGTIVVLTVLGVTWNKLQWLAAALSFGLGFGLQEIFANFVSGIIILFERPVRIGDTVTIGNFSGTVSKIRIRATTITDFDRKEVIIPNKAFVTERLINWSLSDTVTRIIIKLGVAYGSDLEKVRTILLQAAQSNNKIMSDPAPLVFFTNFGDSTLNHELRFYVRQIVDRSTTLDEVNRMIDRLCREHNISIAFNQLEVHFHNNKK